MGVSMEMLIFADSLLVALAVILGASSIGPAWDPIARRRIADLIPQLRSVGLDESRLPELLRWWGLSLVVGVVVVGVALRLPLLAVPVAGLIFAAPRLWLTSLLARRRTLLRDQMAVSAVSLANAARAGLSLAQALERAARETPEPLASELWRIVHEFQRGRPLSEAIAAARDRLSLDGFNLFAAAILVCLERGGRVTDALEGISRSLQEARRLERKLEADTASGRKVVVILAAFPLFFLAGLYLIDPDGVGLIFGTLPGQIILLVVILLILASVKISRRILALEI